MLFTVSPPFVHPWIQPTANQKYLGKKSSRKFQKSKLNLPLTNHCAEYMQMKWCVGIPCKGLYVNIGYMQIHAILQETWTSVDLVSMEGPGIYPLKILRDDFVKEYMLRYMWPTLKLSWYWWQSNNCWRECATTSMAPNFNKTNIFSVSPIFL